MFLNNPSLKATITPKFSIPFTIECPPLECDFNMTTCSGIPSAQLIIYNLASDLINELDGSPKGKSFDFSEIEITAGYDNQKGVAFKGIITNTTSYWWNGKNITLITIADEAYSKACNTIINQSFSKVPPSVIVPAIISALNLSVGKIQINSSKPITYTAMNGFRALYFISEITESNLYFKNGSVFIVPKITVSSPAIMTITDSQLLNPPTRRFGKWLIKTRFNHSIEIGESININSEVFTGLVKVESLQSDFQIGKNNRSTIFIGKQ
jgi:hypothetical protein